MSPDTHVGTKSLEATTCAFLFLLVARALFFAPHVALRAGRGRATHRPKAAGLFRAPPGRRRGLEPKFESESRRGWRFAARRSGAQLLLLRSRWGSLATTANKSTCFSFLDGH